MPFNCIFAKDFLKKTYVAEVTGALHFLYTERQIVSGVVKWVLWFQAGVSLSWLYMLQRLWGLWYHEMHSPDLNAGRKGTVTDASNGLIYVLKRLNLHPCYIFYVLLVWQKYVCNGLNGKFFLILWWMFLVCPPVNHFLLETLLWWGVSTKKENGLKIMTLIFIFWRHDTTEHFKGWHFVVTDSGYHHQ